MILFMEWFLTTVASGFEHLQDELRMPAENNDVVRWGLAREISPG